ncbi:right-handed parallel beta-helix repeat-containing protein [Thermodesulfobacteriota bacterium]
MKSAALSVLFVLIVFASAPALAAPSYSVPEDYPTIQAAIDACPSSACFVNVDEGTYFENINFNGKSIEIYSRYDADVTFIDGDLVGSVVTFDSGEGPDSVLDGFTLQNGSGNGFGTYYGGSVYCEGSSPTIIDCVLTECRNTSYGGGIACIASSSPTITNCTISSNRGIGYHGGGIYCEGSSSPTITECVIGYNIVYGKGGGIYCEGSSPTVIDCDIIGNRAAIGLDSSGGGIYCESASPTISGCTITGNSATHGGGGICCNASSSPSITGCTIDGNAAASHGGGIACFDHSSPEINDCSISGNGGSVFVAEPSWGGGIYLGTGCDSSITNCTIDGNMAAASYGYGGAIACGWSSPTIFACSISGNSASVAGGLWAEVFSAPEISYSFIQNNTAAYDGGGVFVFDDSTATLTNCFITGNTVTTGTAPGFGTGGGFACYQDSTLNLTHCTVADNATTDHGGGVYLQSSTANIIDSILWGDSPDEIYPGAGVSATVTYSDVQGGHSGTGNINDDPLFGSGDYFLSASSPCIDVGIDAGVYFDIELDTRPQGAGFDMGADEYVAPSICGAIPVRGSPWSALLYLLPLIGVLLCRAHNRESPL